MIPVKGCEIFISYTIYEIIIAALAIGTAILAVIVYIGWLDNTYRLSVLTDKKNTVLRIILCDIGTIVAFAFGLIFVGSMISFLERSDVEEAEAKASVLEQRFNEEKAEYDNMEKLAERIAQLIKDGSSERM